MVSSVLRSPSLLTVTICFVGFVGSSISLPANHLLQIRDSAAVTRKPVALCKPRTPYASRDRPPVFFVFLHKTCVSSISRPSQIVIFTMFYAALHMLRRIHRSRCVLQASLPSYPPKKDALNPFQIRCFFRCSPKGKKRVAVLIVVLEFDPHRLSGLHSLRHFLSGSSSHFNPHSQNSRLFWDGNPVLGLCTSKLLKHKDCSAYTCVFITNAAASLKTYILVTDSEIYTQHSYMGV